MGWGPHLKSYTENKVKGEQRAIVNHKFLVLDCTVNVTRCCTFLLACQLHKDGLCSHIEFHYFPYFWFLFIHSKRKIWTCSNVTCDKIIIVYEMFFLLLIGRNSHSSGHILGSFVLIMMLFFLLTHEMCVPILHWKFTVIMKLKNEPLSSTFHFFFSDDNFIGNLVVTTSIIFLFVNRTGRICDPLWILMIATYIII